eukprot:COSAG03_NODE_2106_length_3121_cov_13.283540_3_plen_117_part_00
MRAPLELPGRGAGARGFMPRSSRPSWLFSAQESLKQPATLLMTRARSCATRAKLRQSSSHVKAGYHPPGWPGHVAGLLHHQPAALFPSDGVFPCSLFPIGTQPMPVPNGKMRVPNG